MTASRECPAPWIGWLEGEGGLGSWRVAPQEIEGRALYLRSATGVGDDGSDAARREYSRRNGGLDEWVGRLQVPSNSDHGDIALGACPSNDGPRREVERSREMDGVWASTNRLGNDSTPIGVQSGARYCSACEGHSKRLMCLCDNLGSHGAVVNRTGTPIGLASSFVLT